MAKTDSVTPHCQLPGCSNPVEQPAGGGPRKRFCCDQHRLSYWRQSQRESRTENDSPVGDEAPALALKSALEQSVHSLEAVILRTRTTLIELSSLEEAEAIRKEAFAVAEERVARALAERTSEERRRQAAESLAEAAAASAREAETQLGDAVAQLETLKAEHLNLEKTIKAQATQARKEIESAQREAQQTGEKLLEEIRTEIAARAKAEARAEAAEARVQELKAELATLRGELPRKQTSAKKAKRK